MKSQYDYEIIRDYLHGLTDFKTSQEIANLIQHDEVARSIAEGILLLDEEFKGSESDVDDYLEKFRQKQLETIQKRIQQTPIVRQLWFRVAASLLLLVVSGAVVWLMLTPPDINSILAQEMADRYPVSNLVRSAPGDITPEEKAYELYTAGKYAEAAEFFNTISGQEKDVATAVFYHAMSHLYAGNYARAIQLYQTPMVGESRYAEQARWYQALALLRGGDKNRAVKILRDIRQNSSHFKYDVAGELLSQLE